MLLKYYLFLFFVFLTNSIFAEYHDSKLNRVEKIIEIINECKTEDKLYNFKDILEIEIEILIPDIEADILYHENFMNCNEEKSEWGEHVVLKMGKKLNYYKMILAQLNSWKFQYCRPND